MQGRYLYWFSFILVAIIFVTVFSYTTSPIYSTFGDSPDSHIFQIIGKYWAQGYIPYKDLWDLKGPYIFLLNALGYGMTGSRYGVWFIQIIFLYATLITTFITFRLYCREWSAFGWTILALAGLSYTYQGGNLTEEYLLPFLALSFYYIIRWIYFYDKEDIVTHPPYNAVVYGVVLGLSLMSRLTNALTVCGAVLVISVVLLKHRKFKNLYYNALAFIAGFIFTTIPFVLYFHEHHALQDMWNGTFLFAIKYAEHSTNEIMSNGLHYFILSYFNSILLVLLTLWLVVKEKRLSTSSSLYILSAGLPLSWFCQGNGYGHYGMIVYQLFPVIVLIIYKMKLRLIRFAVIVLVLTGLTSKTKFMFVMLNSWQDTELVRYKTFLKNNTIIDYSSFVSYNCHPSLYLDLNIHPATPVFTIQDFGLNRIPQWRDFLLKSFKESHVKWILIDIQEHKQPGIQELLDERYLLIKHDEKRNLKLYKLKDHNKQNR